MEIRIVPDPAQGVTLERDAYALFGEDHTLEREALYSLLTTLRSSGVRFHLFLESERTSLRAVLALLGR